MAADGSGHTNDIQTGLNLLPATGGQVYIKEGTYTITSAITIPNDNIALIGSGRATRILTTANIPMIDLNNKHYLLIKDLWLDGAGAGNAANAGIHIGTNISNNSRIINCYIQNMGGWGIDGSFSLYNLISGNFFSSNVGDILLGRERNTVTNNFMVSSSGYGIYLVSSNRNIITNNRVTNCNIGGIHVSSSNYNIIKSNICFNNGQTLTGEGIHVSHSDHNIVMENLCYDDQGAGATQDIGIWEDSDAPASNYNIFVGNIATGNVTTQITVTGANSVSANNIIT